MQDLAFETLLLFLAYVVAIFVPGIVAGFTVGLRGWLLAAMAPLLTYGLVGASGSILPLLGLTWSPFALVSVTAFFAVAVALAQLGFRCLLRVPPAASEHTLQRWSMVHHGAVGCAVVVSSVVGVLTTAAATRNFTAVPQIWDAIFHANATHFIATTGLSDPSALQAMNKPAVENFYYPNAYHVLGATVIMVTGAAVPPVLEVGTALTPGLLALAMVALVRYCGGRPALAASAGILACAFTVFPYDLLPWGALLPFITALVLLPALLALWAAVLRYPDTRPIAFPSMLGLGGIGIVALHPSVAVAAAVLGLAFMAQLYYVSRRPRIRDAGAVGIAVVSAFVFGAPLLTASAAAAAGPAYDWPTTLLPADALGQVLLQSHEQTFPQWWLAVLTVIGLFRLGNHRPVLWIGVTGFFFAGLFVLAASYEGWIVTLLTRPWWNDKWRLAALWGVCAIPLAAAGLVAVRDAGWTLLGRLLPSSMPGLPQRGRTAVSAGLLALVLAALVMVTDGLYQSRNEARLAQAFADGPTASTAERRAFDELARIVPENSVVMNDPYDGSAWMWALADVRPVFATPVIAGHELPTMDPDRRVLFGSFSELDTNVAVQRAVRRLDIRYVIICDGFIAPAGGHVPGMHDLSAVDALEPVFSNADARIYKIRDEVVFADRG